MMRGPYMDLSLSLFDSWALIYVQISSCGFYVQIKSYSFLSTNLTMALIGFLSIKSKHNAFLVLFTFICTSNKSNDNIIMFQIQSHITITNNKAKVLKSGTSYVTI